MSQNNYLLLRAHKRKMQLSVFLGFLLLLFAVMGTAGSTYLEHSTLSSSINSPLNDNAGSTAVLASQSDKLTWAPPDGWENYQELEIPSTGGTYNLDPNINYKISAPNVIRAPLALRGGGNIVAIGGHIKIEGPEFDPPADGKDRRALVFRDNGAPDGRIIHFEGWLLDGEDLAEGINPGSSPNTIFQFQNIRVEKVTIRSADDRDGTGAYTEGGNHADVLQIWGGMKELRVDKFTGRSNYQGYFDYETIEPITRSLRYFKRTNMEGIETVTPVGEGGDGLPYANVRLFRCQKLSGCGQWRLDPGTVWSIKHPNSTWSTFFPNPTVSGIDALGQYHRWDGVKLSDGSNRDFARNWDDTDWGEVHEGSPPEGDYVLATNVGLGYISPGYIGDEEESGPAPSPSPSTPAPGDGATSTPDDEESAQTATPSGTEESSENPLTEPQTGNNYLVQPQRAKLTGHWSWSIPLLFVILLGVSVLLTRLNPKKDNPLRELGALFTIVFSSVLVGNVLIALDADLWLSLIATEIIAGIQLRELNAQKYVFMLRSALSGKIFHPLK